jgi:hypothetical protein
MVKPRSTEPDQKASVTERLKRIAGRQTLRLTHYGRKSGKPYEVTIWFAVDGDRLYLLTANVTRQWVRNALPTPPAESSSMFTTSLFPAAGRGARLAPRSFTIGEAPWMQSTTPRLGSRSAPT